MRTNVEILSDVYQTDIKKGDKGYIDGYVKAGDGRPYAVVVILPRGVLGFVPLNQLKAVHLQ